MNTDIIKIPVGLEITPEVQKVLNEIRQRSTQELKNISKSIQEGAIPFSLPTTTAKQQFQSGGKTFEATTLAKSLAVPKQTAEGDIVMAVRYSTTIREIKERISQNLSEDQKRLKAFKDSIKFQPLQIKKDAITDFIKEFGDINNELTSRLENITKLVSAKKFDKLKASLAKLTPEEGIRALDEFAKSNESLVDRIAVERRKLVEIFKKNVSANQKIKFGKVKDSLAGLDIEGQVRELEKQLPAGGEFGRLVERELAKLRDKLKGIRFKDVKADAALKPLEEREKLFQQYIDGGGNFIKEAQKEITKIRTALSQKRIKVARLDANALPVKEQEKFWNDFLQQNKDLTEEYIKSLPEIKQPEIKQPEIKQPEIKQPEIKQPEKIDLPPLNTSEQQKLRDTLLQQHEDLVKQVSREQAKVRDKLKGLRFRDVKSLAASKVLEEREQVFQDYISSGGEFFEEANREVAKIRRLVNRSKFKDAKIAAALKPIQDREQFWEDFRKSNQEFSLQIDQEIKKVRSGLAKQKFSDAKVEAALKPIAEQEQFWMDFGKQNQEFANQSSLQAKRVRDKLKGKSYRDIRAEAALKPLEEREKIFQDYISGGGEFIYEAKRELEKIGSKLKKRRFKDLVGSFNLKPLEDQQNHLRLLISSGGLDPDMLNEATNRLTKVNQRLSKKKFTAKKQEAALLPIEDREKVFQNWMATNLEFHAEAKAEIAKIQNRLKTKKFRKFKSDTESMPLVDQEAAWKTFIAGGGEFIDEANKELNKVVKKLKRQTFKKTKSTIESKSLVDQEAAWKAFIAGGGEFIDEANKELLKVQRKLKTDKFKKFRMTLPSLNTEDQIKAWQAFAAANVEFTDMANAQIAKLSRDFVNKTKSLKRQKFTAWTKKLQTMDPGTALKELDDYISKPTSAFIDDAKIMRKRISRTMESTAKQMKQERSRQMSNLIMLGAGAGLGALGPAGFPLLNVGFAAMSGGPVGAAVVGVITLIGEVSRALENFRQQTIAAAKEIGYVPKSFKLAEADMKGFDAVLGALSLSAEAVGKERKLEVLRENAETLINFSTLWTNVRQGIGITATKELSNIVNKPIDTLMNYFNPFGSTIVGRNADEVAALHIISQDRMPRDLDSAYRSMLAQMTKPTVNVENDPYQTWVRMQNAAFDPNKSMEVEINRKILERVKEIRDIAIGMSNRGPLPTPSSAVGAAP